LLIDAELLELGQQILLQTSNETGRPKVSQHKKRIRFVAMDLSVRFLLLLRDAVSIDLFVEFIAGNSWCKGFRCAVSGYCIASKLRCNKMPNCGIEDESDEENCEWDETCTTLSLGC